MSQAPLGLNSVGPCLGAYRLLRVIGEGGMSIVYLAERADQAYDRQVAVKVQRQGFAGESPGTDVVGAEFLERRFLRERQILAQLEHPNIAGLLDGGTSEDGRPYVVMEYVDGLPIDVYCDRQRLPIDDRLRLFLQVCDAVEYAHCNLIIHRDLKPGNILVTVSGRPKLLDFGIAKLMAGETLIDPSGGTTGPWMRLMTPGYASPEQAAGELVTTASDVYSLGVVLYGLLAGRPPYRLNRRLASEIEKIIAESQPAPCSDALSLDRSIGESEGPLDLPADQVGAARGLRPEALRRALRGDLDLIVAKAMHKEPERRYGSAADFARDLERYLSDLPVAARPDDWIYRAGKLIRRNRAPLIVMGLFVALALSFLVSSYNQAQRLAEERDLARAERDMSQEMLGLLKDTFATFSPESSRGENLTATEILDRGAGRVDTQLEGRPEAQAELLLTLGEVNLGLGRYEIAERQISRAVTLNDEGAKGLSASDLRLLGVAKLTVSRPQEAVGLFHRALELAKAESNLDQQAGALKGLGEASRMQGDFPTAVKQFQDALRVADQLSPEGYLGTADILLDLGRTYLQRGEYDEAQNQVERALKIHRRLLDPKHPRVVQNLQRLLEILIYQDDYERAGEVGRKTLDLQTELLGSEHPELTTTLDYLGRLALELRDYPRAEPYYRRALEISRRSFKNDDPRLAHAVNNMGHCLRLAGKRKDAEPYAFEALEIHRRDADGDPSDLSNSLFNTGVLMEEAGKVEQAIEQYRESLQILRDTHDPGQHAVAFPLVRLGKIYVRKEQWQKAEDTLKEAYELRRRLLPEGHRLIAASAEPLGKLYLRRERYAEAEPLLLETLAFRQRLAKVDPKRAPEVEKYRRQVFRLYQAWGRPEVAADYVSTDGASTDGAESSEG